MILFSLYLVLAAVLSNILGAWCWLVAGCLEELWAGSSKENVIGNMKYNKMPNGKNGRYRNKLFGAIYTHRREICRNIVENYIFIHLNTIWQWAMNKTIILTRTVFFYGDVSSSQFMELFGRLYLSVSGVARRVIGKLGSVLDSARLQGI